MAADPHRVDEFANRMMGALNSSAVVLMTSIGHRTGLFDALAEHPNSTSTSLALAAGLNERYVREWLGAMVTGGIVDYDAVARTYRLPEEHAACLTRAAAPNDLAVFAQYVPLLGSVEDEIVRCFREGGGVPYARYPRFHDVMAEDSGQTVLSVLFDAILPLVPGLAGRLERGARAADMGCGRGKAVLLLAERFPRSTFVGFDLSSEAIEAARAEALEKGLGNAEFIVRDLTTLDRDGDEEAFDLVTTFDAVHDQAAPLALLRGIRRTLRDDGVYLMQDIRGSSELAQNRDHPAGPFLYAISCMHCMPVSLAQGGEGLGTMWGIDTARGMLAEAGFGSVEVHVLPHDFQNAYLVARR